MTTFVRNTIIGGVLSLVIGAIGKNFNDIANNTYYSKLHSADIKELKEQIKEIRYEQKAMPDVYVTRREFQIVIDNLNNTLEKNNDTLEKLADKL